MRDEFYDQGNGLGYEHGHRLFLNGGWPSPRGHGMGMGGLDLGLGSPRLGERLGLEASRDALGAGVYGRSVNQPLGGFCA